MKILIITLSFYSLVAMAQSYKLPTKVKDSELVEKSKSLGVLAEIERKAQEARERQRTARERAIKRERSVTNTHVLERLRKKAEQERVKQRMLRQKELEQKVFNKKVENEIEIAREQARSEAKQLTKDKEALLTTIKDLQNEADRRNRELKNNYDDNSKRKDEEIQALKRSLERERISSRKNESELVSENQKLRAAIISLEDQVERLKKDSTRGTASK